MSTTDPTASALDGLVNLRDVGGLPAEGGSRTRSGVLYRSDAPYAGDRDPDQVHVWPPDLVVDLRDTVELNGQQHPLAEVCEVRHIPLLEGIRHKQEDDGSEPLTGLYQHILNWADEWLVELFRSALRTEGPVLVHCAAGKDRTGVSVALLLSAAGVSRDAIVEDYGRTDQNMFRVLQRLNVAPELPPGVSEEAVRDLVATPTAAIESVVRRFDEYSDGGAGWLRERGVTDAEIEQWRERLLEP